MGYLQGESMDRRFFHTLGASKLDRTICSTAGGAGMRMTVGANIGADTEAVGLSDLILLWGTNTLTANPHLWPFVLQAREKGAPVDLHRPDPDAHGAAMRRVDRDPAGHRRRARARHDARAVRREPQGRRLSRAAHVRRGAAAREGDGVDAGARVRRPRAFRPRRSCRWRVATAARRTRSSA